MESTLKCPTANKGNSPVNERGTGIVSVSLDLQYMTIIAISYVGSETFSIK